MKNLVKVIDGEKIYKKSTSVRAFKRSSSEHVCQCCGAQIVFIGSGRKPSYCSDSCKMKAYRVRKALRNSGAVNS